LLATLNTSPYTYNWVGATVGTHSVTVRATDNNGGEKTSAIVSITVTAITQSPYGGTAISLPGKIEAENYDLGGQGVAYNDATPGNSGGAYRNDDVDVQAAAEGGYNIGYASAGDWTEYTVNVSASGAYNFEFRVAAIAAEKRYTSKLMV
jgi:hypothetical protein